MLILLSFPRLLPASLFIAVLFSFAQLNAQSEKKVSGLIEPTERSAGVLFYNVENLFDVSNDSLKKDAEFTPMGLRRWTYGRMLDKFRKICRVILNAGKWSPPVLVGLCEVENSWVLNLMLDETGLRQMGYRVLHFDSPDERGIDVALLYLQDRFHVVKSEPVLIDFGPGERATRDVLYVKGVLDGLDTMHVLVNHWPSRYGGSAATQWKREFTAQKVRMFTDSLLAQDLHSLVLLMGDFNEPHHSDLFSEYMGSGMLEDSVCMVSPALYLPVEAGTIKYRHLWQIYDQIMVSRSFFEADKSIFIEKPMMQILDFPFLLERDDQFGGVKPFRTYLGMRYHGGYSDHLPIWVELKTKVLVREDMLSDPLEKKDAGGLGNIE
jgi:hypothetical protein